MVHPSILREVLLSSRNQLKCASWYKTTSNITIRKTIFGGRRRLRGNQLQQHAFTAVSTTSSVEEKPQSQRPPLDSICELAASNLRFGRGATKEVGQDLQAMNVNKVIVVTDSNIMQKTSIMDVVMESLTINKISSIVIYDQVHIEPTDFSFRHAIDFFTNQKHNKGGYDAVVAVGGGSVIDTAKAANLYATFPPPDDDFYHYVNPPLGKGMPVPTTTTMATTTSLPPLIAIPTTAGTGSEATGASVFADIPAKSKTGIIANRLLKPTLGIIDPNNTKTLPPMVVAYSGLDVLCHAMESYTALPFTKRPKPRSPLHRSAYQGSNPIGDVWSLFALRLAAKNLVRAVKASAMGYDDEEARFNMLMASTAAGMGFANAGVHLCHGMSYPISSHMEFHSTSSRCNIGMTTNANDNPNFPHGLAVISTAPAVFRFTGMANPERHAICAHILSSARRGEKELIGKPNISLTSQDAGLWLADEIKNLTQELGVPMGLKTFGITTDDVPRLVKGALTQHRVTKLSPRQVVESDLDMLFREALVESY